MERTSGTGNVLIDDYLRLCLRIGRHIEGFVDAYYGPDDLRRAVEAEEIIEAPALIASIHNLKESLDDCDLEVQRVRWLSAQLDALTCVTERLSGVEMQWSEEVRRCFGVAPERFPEEVFEEAHALLDGILEGGGELATRYQAWLDANSVPRDSLKAALEVLGLDFRQRTANRFPLPGGEAVEYEIVEDAPWLAYNWYLGGLRSRIEVNVGVPVDMVALPVFVAHEAYPGHHTEQCIKEALLVREEGCLELTAPVVAAPEMLISEGIASLALDQVLQDDPSEDFLVDLLARVGLKYRAEEAAVVRKSEEILTGVLVNSARLLHEEDRSEEEVLDYICQWSLRDRDYAANLLRFISDPVWRAYPSTYTDGPRVCRAFVEASPDGFRRLLTEQLTVSEVIRRGESSDADPVPAQSEPLLSPADPAL